MKYGFTIRYPQPTKNILITKSSGMLIYAFISVPEGLGLEGSTTSHRTINRMETRRTTWKEGERQRGAGKRSGALLIRGARKCQEMETMTQYFAFCIDRSGLYGERCLARHRQVLRLQTLRLLHVTFTASRDRVTASRFK